MATTIESNLFPPIVDSYQPAFIANGRYPVARVYFSLSDYNTEEELHSTWPVQIKIQYLNSNQSAVADPEEVILTKYYIDETKQGQDKYFVEISSLHITNGWNLNEYYRVQLRLTRADAAPADSLHKSTWLSQNAKYFSQWSTVTLIYGIAAIGEIKWYGELSGQDIESYGATLHTDEVLIAGKIQPLYSSQAQYLDPLQSYQFFLYDQNETILYQQSNIISVLNNQNPYQFQYVFKNNIQKQKKYKVIINFTTKHLYKFSESLVFLVEQPNIPFNVSLSLDKNDQNGYITVTITNIDDSNPGLVAQTTVVSIKRTSNKDNFAAWQEMEQISIENTSDKKIIWKDYTVEPGLWYKYKITNVRRRYRPSVSIISQDPIMIYSDDIFLISEGKQLKIRYNPVISSFNIKTIEMPIETIGNPYPFIRRNADVYYKTFALSGTITHFMDAEGNLFNSSDNDLYQNGAEHYRTFNQQNHITSFNDFIKEREFRNQVMDFLYSGSPVLYRSLTEGNILIKLLDVNFTPNTTLGRMIYDFSCTAYEIDECSINNYKKYNTRIVEIIEEPLTEEQGG